MADQITLSKTLSIRECGLDEYWLQDQIAANPNILGLGDLEVVKREKKQSSGGKLDMLLEDSEDGSMYEVEVMLGKTDESHIIRALEYWDLERKRWPKRQHTAVLVAESINRRFFNVIQLVSFSTPVIAIQANIVEVEGKKALHFTRILDAYEEPDVAGDAGEQSVGVEDWQKKAPWTVETAKAILPILQVALPKLQMDYVKSYVAFFVPEKSIAWFHRRNDPKSHLNFWLDEAVIPEIKQAFDAKNIHYQVKGEIIHMTLDKGLVESSKELFTKIGELMKKSLEK